MSAPLHLATPGWAFCSGSLAGLSAEVAAALFAAIWQGTLLVSAVAFCLRPMRGLSAAARSAIWLNVFALLLVLPLAPAFATAPDGAATAASPVRLDLRWSVGIVCAWAVLSAWRAVELVSSAIRLRHIARRATPVATDPALLPLLEGEGRFGRRARLCVSTDVERPCVFGFFRPRILMPPALLEALSADELRQVVLHETGHLHRGDDWANLLQKLALVLFPLNPALFWVERRLCAERELACDDRVLRLSRGRKSYALCLTRLAEYSLLQRGVSLVLGAVDRHSELVRRVRRILAQPAQSMPTRRAVCVSGGLVLAALAAAVGLTRSPQLVSFAPAAPVFEARSEFAAGFAPQLVKAAVARPTVPADTRSDTPALAPVHSHPATAAAHPAAYHKPRPVLPDLVPPTAEIATRDLPPAEQLPVRQEYVVLTEWSDSAVPQLVIPVAHPVRPRFAAVPFADGWLIVQI